MDGHTRAALRAKRRQDASPNRPGRDQGRVWRTLPGIARRLDEQTAKSLGKSVGNEEPIPSESRNRCLFLLSIKGCAAVPGNLALIERLTVQVTKYRKGNIRVISVLNNGDLIQSTTTTRCRLDDPIVSRAVASSAAARRSQLATPVSLSSACAYCINTSPRTHVSCSQHSMKMFRSEDMNRIGP